MNEGRRPITAEERPHAEALGRLLRGLRDEADMTQAQLGALATLQSSSVSAIERGRRRTRRSTLERLVVVLVAEHRRDAILAELVEAAGPALAPESDWAERLERRRQLREWRDLPAAIDAARDALKSAKRLARVWPAGHPRHEFGVEHVAQLELHLAELEAKAANPPIPERRPMRRRPDRGPAWHALQEYARSLLPPGRTSGRLYPNAEQQARLAELKAAAAAEADLAAESG